MSVTLDISAAARREFDRAVAECIKHTERTYPEFINGQALRLASFALRETERADAGKIAWNLGQTDLRFTNKRTGAKLKKARRVFGSSAASINLYRIVNWRRKRAGLKPLGGKEMSGPARRMRGAALRSTGFIASGWVWAIRGMARAVGYSADASRSTKVSGSPKGYAQPARFTISSNASVEIGNTALLAVSAARTGKRQGRPMPIAQKGLSRAFILTARDMIEHLRSKLIPVFNRFSA